MAEYTFPNQSNYGWGLTFNMTGKAPIVSKRIFETLTDAQTFVNNVNESAIEGLILSVIADGDNNGAYFVESIGDGTNDGVLKKIGSDSSEDITNLQNTVATLQGDVEDLKKIDHTAFIKGVKVNGETLTPVDQVVDITINTPTYETVISEVTKDSTNAPQTKAVYDYVTTFVNGVKTDLETKLSAVENFKFQVVNSYDELPKTEISLSTIYLVKNGTSGNNIYTEYIYTGENHWEILGELKFDPTELEGRVNNFETTLNGDGTDDNPGLIKKVTNLEKSLNGKISDLEERLTGLVERLTTAEGNITTNTNDITAIKGRLDTAEGNIDDLTTKIDGDGGDNPGLITNVTNLKTEVTTIKGTIDNITSTGGEPNVIETIQLNGVSIQPVDKTVNISIDAITNDEIDTAITTTQA